MSNQPRAVVLLSGGLDSATALAVACNKGFACHSLSFDYGQRHYHELAAAEKISKALGATDHRVIRLDLRAVGGSALTADIEVPEAKNFSENSSKIPVTYVPARNTIFLSMALAWAEVLDAADIFIGVTAVDYSGYPDCRPEYIEAFESMANLATKMSVQNNRKITIHAPLINMKKSEIIKKGLSLKVDYSLTHSCYNPDSTGRACGKCDSCILRKKGFSQAGVADPTPYSEENNCYRL
jgi:7-cyano-7-deazaguanine synthase